jgi:hypothetical protein
MPGPNSGSFHTVTDPEQARLLMEPVSKEFFKPFLAHERSASEAATLVRCSLNTMLYRIKTLVHAGLIEVVREQPRKGRTIKVYRSLHDAYFVPFSVTPYATLEERLGVQAEPIFAGLIRAYAAALKQNERYGHHIFIGENGAVWTSDLLPVLSPTGQPVVYSDMTVRLRAEDARALGQELSGLFARAVQLGAQAHNDDAAQSYLHMVALLPLEEGYRS